MAMRAGRMKQMSEPIVAPVMDNINSTDTHTHRPASDHNITYSYQQLQHVFHTLLVIFWQCYLIWNDEVQRETITGLYHIVYHIRSYHTNEWQKLLKHNSPLGTAMPIDRENNTTATVIILKYSGGMYVALGTYMLCLWNTQRSHTNTQVQRLEKELCITSKTQ